MKKYDVIIVGAGPAGVGAAKILEKSDLEFCIIDKCKFPRHKLCGGGLTFKSQNALKKLGLSIDEIDTIESAKTRIVAKGISKEVELNKSIIMVDRNEFDYNNLKQVKCDVFEDENIANIEGNILTTNKNLYEFKYIIFADGLNGYSRKLIEDREFGFCVEYDIKGDFNETILDFRAIEDGYGWIFPKKGHVTIGLGNFNKKKSDYLDLLYKFAKEYGFKIDKTKIMGYHIPIFSKDVYKKSVIDNKYILVGDAASLVDAISGEGIYYALTSGMYAAESIIESIKNNGNLSDIYFEKTKNLCASLEKRLKASNMLYSRMGNYFIKMGLNNKTILEKIKNIFG